MQAVVLQELSTVSNTDPSAKEVPPVMLNKMSDQSQVCTDPTTTKLDPASNKKEQNRRIQRSRKKSEAGRWTDSESYYQSFRETVCTRKYKKTLQDTFLVLATFWTAIHCTLPTVIYFAVEISA